MASLAGSSLLPERRTITKGESVVDWILLQGLDYRTPKNHIEGKGLPSVIS